MDVPCEGALRAHRGHVGGALGHFEVVEGGTLEGALKARLGRIEGVLRVSRASKVARLKAC